MLSAILPEALRMWVRPPHAAQREFPELDTEPSGPARENACGRHGRCSLWLMPGGCRMKFIHDDTAAPGIH